MFLKWLPQLLMLAKKLEESVAGEIIQFQVKIRNEKIDIIFLSKKPANERANELDNIFKP